MNWVPRACIHAPAAAHPIHPVSCATRDATPARVAGQSRAVTVELVNEKRVMAFRARLDDDISRLPALLFFLPTLPICSYERAIFRFREFGWEPRDLRLRWSFFLLGWFSELFLAVHALNY